MVWGCFAASGPGQLAIIEGKMNFIKTFWRRMLGYLSAIWISPEVGWCIRTTTQNTEVNQQQTGFNRSLTSTRLRCCGMISSEQFTPDIARILLNWNSFVRGMVQNSSWQAVQVWSTTTENGLVEIIAAKGGSTKGSHTFSKLQCECIHGAFNKDLTIIMFVLLV